MYYKDLFIKFDIYEELHQKPEMIMFYNIIKAGIDRMDQMSTSTGLNGEHAGGCLHFFLTSLTQEKIINGRFFWISLQGS